MLKTELFDCLKSYFANNPELMSSLEPGSIWEYIIRTPKLDGEESTTILTFHLIKIFDADLDMVEGPSPEKPDLILYFTEKAILSLIKDFPAAKDYYKGYRQIMENPTDELDLDYKINKPRLKLWRLGYRAWSKLYNFSQIAKRMT